jgi:ApbE superfamily uncharacterized protein (UPF0280 family)
MALAGQRAGVGPMAAVAGAIAEWVGRALLSENEEVIVENGGDIFLKTGRPVTVGVFAGRSPLNMKIGLRVDSGSKPAAVCTSSGTFGHSLSRGSADAVCVQSASCALADAVATAAGNRVRTAGDITSAIDFVKSIDPLGGILIVKDDTVGMWGDLKVVPLAGKKG